MNFDYTEEQTLLENMVTSFVRDDYDWDTRCSIVKTEEGWKEENWKKFAELGLLGVPFEENHGGLGGEATDIMIVMEQFGKGLVVEPYMPSIILAGGLISKLGSADQKNSIIPEIISGDRRYVFAYAEPQSRFDLFDVKYVHIFEPQRTNADYQQAIGRATRLCGQKGLEFKPNRGWKLHVFNYESHFPSGKTLHEVYLKHSDLKLDEIKIREELERISIESAVDYDLNVHINKFSLDAQEDMNTKSHVNSTMTGGARKNPIDFSKIKCENGKYST